MFLINNRNERFEIDARTIVDTCWRTTALCRGKPPLPIFLTSQMQLIIEEGEICKGACNIRATSSDHFILIFEKENDYAEK